MQIEQALHGYSQGHRLLAHSGSLRPEELDQLDRLSDLAGYLPDGLSFKSYVTGFPCGRFYAFASTWPDLEAPRSGAVLTHTLLLPLGSATTLSDLFALNERHRFPSADRSPYERSLEWSATDTSVTSPLTPPPTKTRDAVALLLFGQEQRPIVWIDDGDLIRPVRWAWRLLWPEARSSWSFCTLALQPRSLSGQPFSWLAAPPKARAGLHSLARSKAWWDDGHLKDRTLERRRNEPWVHAVHEPSKAHDIVRHTHDAGISTLAPPQLPIASRFLELEEAASQRLPAARTRADFLAQLAPTFEAAPSAWVEILTLLADHQRSAPIEPRPLWDLEDLLDRQPLHEAVLSDGEGRALLKHLSAIVRSEVEHRLRVQPQAAVARLPTLYQHAVASHVSEAVLDAVSQTITQFENESASALARTIALTPEAPILLVAEALRHLPRPEQKLRLVELLEAGRNDTDLDTLTTKLSDAELALEFGLLRDRDPVSCLEVAARIHIDRKGRDDEWRRLLASTSTDTVWEWSLSSGVATPSLLRTTWHWCGQHGDAKRLAELARATPRGGEAMSMAYRKLSYYGLRDVFSKHPELAQATAMASLASNEWDAGRIARLAIEGSPKLAISNLELRLALKTCSNTSVVDDLLNVLFPEVLGLILKPMTTPKSLLGGWLSTPMVQRLLGRSSIFTIEEMLRQKLTPSALGAALPNLLSVIDPTEFGRIAWSTPLLTALIRSVDARTLCSTSDDLVFIVNLPLHPPRGDSEKASQGEDEDAHLFLMGECLGAIRKTQCLQCKSLVMAVFYPIYSRLLRDDPGSLRDCRWWRDLWWDRAKKWRHWLLDVAVEGNWPGSVVRAATNEDEELLELLATRAHKNRSSREYWMRNVTMSDER